MALFNIVGDLGYLGYAFAAEGFVSFPKLVGACFTMSAHIILLAYGDDQANIIATEKGTLSHIILGLRENAKKMVRPMPWILQNWVRAKPVGVSFCMLAVNGVGLLGDALARLSYHAGPAMIIQSVLGILILLGCSTFAVADFVAEQKMADILTKIAPTILTCASLANIGLAVTTWNIFVIISVIAFALSNFAGFYTRLDKEKGQHLHS